MGILKPKIFCWQSAAENDKCGSEESDPESNRVVRFDGNLIQGQKRTFPQWSFESIGNAKAVATVCFPIASKIQMSAEMWKMFDGQRALMMHIEKQLAQAVVDRGRSKLKKGGDDETSLWLSLYFCETTVFEVISPLVRRLLADEPGLLVLP